MTGNKEELKKEWEKSAAKAIETGESSWDFGDSTESEKKTHGNAVPADQKLRNRGTLTMSDADWAIIKPIIDESGMTTGQAIRHALRQWAKNQSK